MLKTNHQAIRRKLPYIIVTALLAATGLALLQTTSAATFAATTQAEAGVRTTNATLTSDTTASGGAAVKFTAATSSGGGGICTNPFAQTSVDRGDITIPGKNGQYLVRNEAWNPDHGPQTIYACSEKSWYVMSNQPNLGGAVQTYPDSQYIPSGSKTISQYTSITSTFGEEYPAQGDWNAGYDLWLVKYGTDIMIWNEWHGGPGFWATQAKIAVTLGGVPYHFYNNGGELMFFRDTQVKSGSVDLLAAYKWLAAQGYISATDSLEAIDYGIEICGTNGTTMRFDTTDFSVNVN